MWKGLRVEFVMFLWEGQDLFQRVKSLNILCPEKIMSHQLEEEETKTSVFSTLGKNGLQLENVSGGDCL